MQRRVRVLTGIIPHALRADLIHRDLLLPLADEFHDLDVRVAQQVTRDVVQAVLDQLLSEIFVIFDSWRVMPFRCGYHVPLFNNIGVVLGFFRRGRVLRAEQLPARLVPIGVGEFIRLPLRDERDFARALFHFIGRRCAEAIAVN